nr:MAG TPA: hypothetical protein [Caudoviricetes sp.]
MEPPNFLCLFDLVINLFLSLCGEGPCFRTQNPKTLKNPRKCGVIMQWDTISVFWRVCPFGIGLF